MWRPIVALLAATIVSAGGGTPSSARLTIEAHTGSLESVLIPSDATLDCGREAHATGFLRNVAKPACALVRTGAVAKLAAQHHETRLCSEATGGPQRAVITGTIGRQRINLSIDRTDGCGIADWDQLRALLGDPERRDTIPRRPPKQPPSTTAAPTTYQVQQGDTLTVIAKKFHTSVAAIVATNHLPDPDHLALSQQLVMPPPSAVRIDVALADSGAISVVRLTLVGANPAELVTFVITMPDGSTYTGSPHLAAPTGVVTTTYNAALGLGTYKVAAIGERGTTAETAFHVDPPG